MKPGEDWRAELEAMYAAAEADAAWFTAIGGVTVLGRGDKRGRRRDNQSGSHRLPPQGRRRRDVYDAHPPRQTRRRLRRPVRRGQGGRTRRYRVGGADERFERADESYASAYGYDPEEIPGRHWTELHPEAEVKHSRTHVLPVVEAGGQWSGHSEGLRADGSTFTESKLVTSLDDGRLLIAVSEFDGV